MGTNVAVSEYQRVVSGMDVLGKLSERRMLSNVYRLKDEVVELGLRVERSPCATVYPVVGEFITCE